MEKPLKFTWELFTSKFEKILIIMLITTLPLLILHNFAANFIFAITPSFTAFSFGDIYYGLITLLLFIYAQVPYIRFVYAEYTGHELSLSNSLYHFLVNGFTVFLFACMASILGTIGFMLFLIPGLIFLTLVFPIPYISVFDGKSVWKSFKEGIRIGKKKFWKIALILFLTASIEFIVGAVAVQYLFYITSSYAAQIITQIVINLLFFPFITILVASHMIKWRESIEFLEIENIEKPINI